MTSRPQSVVWPAAPHTIAKIDILSDYLVAWFQILGTGRAGSNIFYVDGFAGPGEYLGKIQGSPLAALEALRTAKMNSSGRWRAGKVRCIFVEDDKPRFEHLETLVKTLAPISDCENKFVNDSFEDAVKLIEAEYSSEFRNSPPCFYFIDPFGPTGVSFTCVSKLLSRQTSEVLINFDADGVSRIFKSGDAANHKILLDRIFGDDSWMGHLDKSMDFNLLTQEALSLYKRKLRDLANIKYVFSFEMRGKSSAPLYYLIFASQHPLGLVKMKEAMKRVDETGRYSFYAADVGQQALFNFEDPRQFGEAMYMVFRGKTVFYQAVVDYALNETPFLNPKKMLKHLEDHGAIEVISTNPKRKHGTYPDGTILKISFLEKRNV